MPVRPRSCAPSRLRGNGIWAVGIAVTLLLAALFATALHLAAPSARANTTLCLQQFANDEHVSLEAFFQNPAQQDTFVEAMTVCSR